MKTAIELAREIGFHSAVILWIYSGKESALCDSEVKELRNIERLVEATIAQEREECAKVFDNFSTDGHPEMLSSEDAAEFIRSRNNP